MPILSKRTEGFTDSVIRRMTRISNQYGAVNLSQAKRITTSTPLHGVRRISVKPLLKSSQSLWAGQ